MLLHDIKITHTNLRVQNETHCKQANPVSTPLPASLASLPLSVATDAPVHLSTGTQDEENTQGANG